MFKLSGDAISQTDGDQVTSSDSRGTYLKPDLDRRALCCGTAKLAGLTLALSSLPSQAVEAKALLGLPLVQQVLEGIDFSKMWDTHFHLLGTGDADSGCWINPRLSQWWRPVDVLRKHVILGASGVPDPYSSSGSVDIDYVKRINQLTVDFPVGSKWMLFAFDAAFDDQGRESPDWSTFKIPNAYARRIAVAHPERFQWVASIHPYRENAVALLEQAIMDGAVALKWLPSSMNIDLRDTRLRRFYDVLSRTGLPLIIHCGEEKAVPGAGRDDLGNPLLVRIPLHAGVQVIIAHCASLGQALDLDSRRPQLVPAFKLFERLMEEARYEKLLKADVSAVFQVNRSAEVWKAVLRNQHWHSRLLHGSDYPLPGVGPLYSTRSLVRNGLLKEELATPLDAIRKLNPLMFDFALKRVVSFEGRKFSNQVFQTKAHFDHPVIGGSRRYRTRLETVQNLQASP